MINKHLFNLLALLALNWSADAKEILESRAISVFPGHAGQLEFLATAGEEIIMERTAPEYLFKIVSKKEWKDSMHQTEVVPSFMDKDFIHLAKEDQVERVIQKYWKDEDYVILKLLTSKLAGKLVYEANPGGQTLYYHLYDGTLPQDAVVEITIVNQKVMEF